MYNMVTKVNYPVLSRNSGDETHILTGMRISLDKLNHQIGACRRIMNFKVS